MMQAALTNRLKQKAKELLVFGLNLHLCFAPPALSGGKCRIANSTSAVTAKVKARLKLLLACNFSVFAGAVTVSTRSAASLHHT